MGARILRPLGLELALAFELIDLRAETANLRVEAVSLGPRMVVFDAHLIFDDRLLLLQRLENDGVAAAPRGAGFLADDAHQHLIFADDVAFMGQNFGNRSRTRRHNADDATGRHHHALHGFLARISGDRGIGEGRADRQGQEQGEGGMRERDDAHRIANRGLTLSPENFFAK